MAPCLKRGGVQVRVLRAVLLEESVQRLQRARGHVEAPAQSPFQIDIPGEDGLQARQKHGSENRPASCQHCPSFCLSLPCPPPARSPTGRSPLALLLRLG